MRLATFSVPTDPTPRIGVVVEGGLVDARQAIGSRWPGEFPGTLLELVRSGPDAWHRLTELLAGSRATLRAADVRWHAPIPRPQKNIFCLGLNYASHIQETSKPGRAPKMPEVPVFFTKAPTAVNGPYDSVEWNRAVTRQVDYEVELAATRSSTTCRRATSSSVTASGSRGKASTASARWGRSS